MLSERVEAPTTPTLEDAVVPASDVKSRPQNPTYMRGVAIEREDILVVTKLSKFEWDKRHSGLSEEALLAQYREQGEGGGRILASHYRQAQVAEDLSREISPQQILPVDQLTPEIVSQYKLVIALGGDDHLKMLSHWIDDDTPIVGVNSDPDSSEGHLMSFTASDLPHLLKRIEEGNYLLEPWTRLRVSVDGVDQGPALSEIVLAKQDFRLMSRHQLELKGEKVVQKSSGLIISTGAGSTGWFASAGLYLAPEGRPFERTAPFARFELREPHIQFVEEEGHKKAIFPPLVEGVLLPGETLTVTSLNNSQGIASRDSIDTIGFDRGTVAQVRIDDKPLWVIAPMVSREEQL